MTTETITIENLKCGGCANTIKTNLEKMSQVSSASVDIEKGEVEVTHGNDIERKDLTDLLGKLGYPEVGHGTTFQKVKSYVSCAIGRINAHEE